MTQGWDAAIAAIAGRQRTIVAHYQLLAIGCSRRVIAHWVTRGRLHVVFHGVYSVVSGELPPLAREQAALLAYRERAFLSHHTGAAVWGLQRGFPVEVELSVVGRRCDSREGIQVHQIKTIARRDLRRHHDLWVSSPARAVLEIAATASAEELTYAIDEGLAHRRFTAAELDDVLARHRPCRGAARLAAILGDPTATAVSRSKREKRLLQAIRDAGLPMPETNVPFGRFELDFYWRREGLVVEIDGETFHRGPGAVRRDREKGLAVRAAGLEMLRFTAEHVLKRLPMVLVTIAGALARLSS
jgi:very-short-patch-repair endonuclease/mRNA-degrading endonuclease toxin of MazEF toxin-antitoxin module